MRTREIAEVEKGTKESESRSGNYNRMHHRAMSTEKWEKG